jgi:hypothetical protein
VGVGDGERVEGVGKGEGEGVSWQLLTWNRARSSSRRVSSSVTLERCVRALPNLGCSPLNRYSNREVGAEFA